MLTYLLYCLLFGSFALLGLNVAGLLRRSPGIDSLRAFAGPPDRLAGLESYAVQLTQRIGARFPHGWAKHDPTTNYLAWAAGLLVPRLGQMQGSGPLLRFASQAICGQQAQVFVDACTLLGQPARIVGLDGHVVVEAFYDDQWHGFDPDYGVIYRVGEEIASVQQVADDPQLARQLYAHHRLDRSSDEVLQILARRQLHPQPTGAPLAPRLRSLERCLRIATWLLPLAGILVAATLWLSGLVPAGG